MSQLCLNSVSTMYGYWLGTLYYLMSATLAYILRYRKYYLCFKYPVFILLNYELQDIQQSTPCIPCTPGTPLGFKLEKL